MDETLELFGFGVDDVVPKPVHARELLARLKVIDLREKPASVRVATKEIVLFHRWSRSTRGGCIFSVAATGTSDFRMSCRRAWRLADENSDLQ